MNVPCARARINYHEGVPGQCAYSASNPDSITSSKISLCSRTPGRMFAMVTAAMMTRDPVIRLGTKLPIPVQRGPYPGTEPFGSRGQHAPLRVLMIEDSSTWSYYLAITFYTAMCCAGGNESETNAASLRSGSPLLNIYAAILLICRGEDRRGPKALSAIRNVEIWRRTKGKNGVWFPTTVQSRSG